MQTFIIALLFSTGVLASDYTPNPENGAFQHGDYYIDCHRVDNHEALYTRENRIVQESIRLNEQVSACVPVLSLGLLPEEEGDVVEFLNREYYQFGQRN